MGKPVVVAAAVVVVAIAAVVVDVVWGDLTTTTVIKGDCVCATTRVNARTEAGLSGTVVTTLTTGQCGTICGGILTTDGYKWYEINQGGQRLWVAGKYFSKSSSCLLGDLTTTKVKSGECVCAKTRVNARDKAGLSGTVVITLPTGQCATFKGGILTTDGYKWYEIDYSGQRLWTVGNYLAKSSVCSFSSSSSDGNCSAEQRKLACQVLAKHQAGIIDLATRHPSGVKDNAYAYNNIRDMFDGKQASRSSYSCSECQTGTPGGSVCLTRNLLKYLLYLARKGYVIVNELAGACHSCRSRHYSGQAVDLHNDYRTAEYITTCGDQGGWAQDEGSHVHCHFFD